MKNIIEKTFEFFSKHKQINAFVICLCASFSLWLFITYGKEYEHSVSYPISFMDNDNKVEYYTQDSIITLTIKTNGFNFLAKNTFSKKKHLTIDVDKLNIDLSKGKVSIASSRIKSQIINHLGFRGMDVTLSPQTIDLTWNKMYSKSVKIVSKCKFSFEKPFDAYLDPELLVDEVIIEGSKKDITPIDTIFTEQINYNNINHSGVFLTPLDTKNLPKGITCRMKSVPIAVRCEKYTENIVSLDIKPVRFEDYKSIEFIPKQVKLRYKVAIKDYKKVNSKDINAYVLCSEENLNETSKLKVYLSNVPKYIQVINLYPEKVEYILFK